MTATFMSSKRWKALWDCKLRDAIERRCLRHLLAEIPTMEPDSKYHKESGLAIARLGIPIAEQIWGTTRKGVGYCVA
jgi:hypothetical protein